jgi:hypothetical protein
MKVTLTQNSCVVEKESGDPHFSNGGYANAESTFLYHVKQELIKQGFDVIKKRMWKDGHMVDEHQQYIRTRHWGGDNDFCISNLNWAIRDAGQTFNEYGMVILAREWYKDM